ncbi:thioredoxin family protein [Flectobacillus major]|uniref:thioredoxin family protein n=1 Tax=Flectobacillus major TaxID=103 RepID=UPI000405A0CC|nr:thioredoxin family protein [Flectobacillus major]
MMIGIVKGLSLAYGLLVAQHSFSQNILEATFFQGSYEEVLQEAQKQKKPIFLTFSASWCQPCKKLEDESFSDQTLASIMSLRYIAKIIDVEQFVGMDVADIYHVSEYPISIVLDYKGKELKRLRGFFPPDYLINILSKYPSFRPIK